MPLSVQPTVATRRLPGRRARRLVHRSPGYGMAGPDRLLADGQFEWLSLELQRAAPWKAVGLVATFAALLILAFVAHGFVGPVTEELYFRGHVLARLERYESEAPIVGARLFPLYHVQLCGGRRRSVMFSAIRAGLGQDRHGGRPRSGCRGLGAARPARHGDLGVMDQVEQVLTFGLVELGPVQPSNGAARQSVTGLDQRRFRSCSNPFAGRITSRIMLSRLQGRSRKSRHLVGEVVHVG